VVKHPSPGSSISNGSRKKSGAGCPAAADAAAGRISFMSATTHAIEHLQHRRTVFDGWRSMVIAIFMTLVGYGVLVGVPVISTAWVNLLGFSEVQVGRVAGADLGAVLASVLVGRFNRRWLALYSASLAIACNLLCMEFQQYEQVLWLRVGAGVGSGVYTAVGMATLAGTSKPSRAYNFMLFAFCFSQALEMKLLPTLSMNGIYMAFVVSYAFGLLFLRWIPERPVYRALDVEIDVEEASHRHHLEHRHVPAWIPWLCMGAILFTYIDIGSYWTYIELAALDAKLQEDFVGSVLVWGSFLTMVGCLVVTVFSNRFGLARPLLFTFVAMAGVAWMLTDGITEGKLLVSVFGFNLLWIFVDVYQMSTAANIDHSGAFAALIPGAQGLGQILGPNIAASLLGAGLGYGAVFTMSALATLTGMLIFASMYLWLRRNIPALADAS
jgi:predicted MFS family arabinose efflux permease